MNISVVKIRTTARATYQGVILLAASSQTLMSSSVSTPDKRMMMKVEAKTSANTKYDPK